MRPYKRTETWLLIPDEDRPPAVVAQQIISVAMRSAYLWFSRQTTFWGAACLAISIGLSMAGLDYLTVDGKSAAYIDETQPFLHAIVDQTSLVVP